MINHENEPREIDKKIGRMVLVRFKTGITTTYLATGIVNSEGFEKEIVYFSLIQVLLDKPVSGKDPQTIQFIDLQTDVSIEEIVKKIRK